MHTDAGGRNSSEPQWGNGSERTGMLSHRNLGCGKHVHGSKMTIYHLRIKCLGLQPDKEVLSNMLSFSFLTETLTSKSFGKFIKLDTKNAAL